MTLESVLKGEDCFDLEIHNIISTSALVDISVI